LTKLPSVVQSLKRTLVPIVAMNVRICAYGGLPRRLERSGRVVVPANVKSLEDTTNRLVRVPDRACELPLGALVTVVTFASNARQVDITEYACGVASNGVRLAESNAKWLNELRRYTKLSPALSGAVGGPTG
jgi:hypothetical protein